tara:strand:+ start:2843 stop:3733 length:891 start_codon:yes stop_codon:yes gene_type:complete
MFDSLDTGTLDVFSSFTGSSLELPKGFWKPGTGSIYNAYMGKTSILGYGVASVSIGMNPDSPFALYGAPGNINLFNGNITIHMGELVNVGSFFAVGKDHGVVVADSLNVSKLGINLSKDLLLAGTNAALLGGTVTIGAGNLTINGLSWFGYVVPKLAVAGKGFDIPHPTKPDTHRLRYICLEGPEVGTYLRGKLKDSNVIELPEYWTENFIDTESITVNLTPVGSFQELFVKEIVGTKVIIGNNSGNQINCNYTVFAERKLNDKLQVEYEGQSPADYPGDNSQYSLAGWDYDRRTS